MTDSLSPTLAISILQKKFIRMDTVFETHHSLLEDMVRYAIQNKNDNELERLFSRSMQLALQKNIHTNELSKLIILLLWSKEVQQMNWLPKSTLKVLLECFTEDMYKHLIQICMESKDSFIVILINHVKKRFPHVIDDLKLYSQLVANNGFATNTLEQIIPLEYRYQCNKNMMVWNSSLPESQAIMHNVIEYYFCSKKEYIESGSFGSVYTFVAYFDGVYHSLVCKETRESDSFVDKPNEIQILTQLFKSNMFEDKGVCAIYGHWFDIVTRKWYICMKQYDKACSKVITPMAILNLLKCVQCLHDTGIVHGDIDESNVLCDDTWKGNELILCDFGLSKPCGMHKLENDMPHRYRNKVPECITGDIVRTELIDVYQLGKYMSRCVLQYVDVVMEKQQKKDLEELVSKMTQVDPQTRIHLPDAIQTFESIFYSPEEKTRVASQKRSCLVNHITDEISRKKLKMDIYDCETQVIKPCPLKNTSISNMSVEKT